MARKAFVADEATREKVRHLAGLGVPQDDIAIIIGCAPKTLRKRFRDELDRGAAEANAMISGYLFAAAKAGNTTAQIFWLKTRAGWKEGGSAASTVQDAGPHPHAVLVLPDNNRDPELTEVLRAAQAKYFARGHGSLPKRGREPASIGSRKRSPGRKRVLTKRRRNSRFHRKFAETSDV
jgi:hypothetical protein